MEALVAPGVEHQNDRHLVWNILQAGPVVAGLLLELWGLKAVCFINHYYGLSFPLLCLHQLLSQCGQFFWKVVIGKIFAPPF